MKYYKTLKEEYIDSIWINNKNIDSSNYTIIWQKNTDYSFDLDLILEESISSGTELKIILRKEKIENENIKIM